MRNFVLLALIAGLVACGSQPVKVSTEPQTLNSVEEYLALANQSQGELRNQYLLAAAELTLAEQQWPLALQLLSQMDIVSFSQSQQQQYSLVYARAQLGEGNSQAALMQLETLPDQLLPQLASRKLGLLAKAYQLEGNYFQSLVALLDRNQLLEDEFDLANNSDQIWQLLTEIPLAQITLFKDSAFDERAAGWLELANIARSEISDPEQFLQQVRNWQAQYPQHQQAYVLPQAIEKALATQPFNPKKIALALPLSGNFSKAAETIRDGFVTALVNQPSAPELVILDSEAPDFIDTMNALPDLGIDFVVGPLTKEKVFDVATLVSTQVPILALNQIESLPTLGLDLAQFGLPIEDEAVAIAEYVAKQGFKKALLLMPDTANGTRLGEAFTQTFNQKQGLVAETVSYADSQQLEEAVKSLLGIEQSFQRHQAINAIVGKELEFEPRRRQDIDFIVFSAPPQIAKRVKPFLNFYYAHDLPVFSNSSIYNGINDADVNKDLSGIYFVDSRWALEVDSKIVTLKQSLKAPWSQKVQEDDHLFALGYDAFSLIKQLPLLSTFKSYRLPAMSGHLYLDESKHIRRQPTWAKIENGLVKPLTSQ